MAYLDFVKTRGTTYVYLKKYVGHQDYIQKKEKRIMSLGRIEKAYWQLSLWQMDKKTIPTDIKKELEVGRVEQINEWLNSVRNRGAF